MTDAQLTAWLDQEDAHLAQLIRAHRWAVQYVGPGELAEEPAFGYTVGLFGLGHPELVVVGLAAENTHGLLQRVAGLVSEGRDLLPGELLTSPDCLEAVAVEALPNPGDVLLSANHFYQRPPEVSVPAFQLTWQDEDGFFPWDTGYRCGPGCQPRPGTWHA